MTRAEYNKRVLSAIKDHESILAKAMAYSEDLRDNDLIDRMKANIMKLASSLLREGQPVPSPFIR